MPDLHDIENKFQGHLFLAMAFHLFFVVSGLSQSCDKGTYIKNQYQVARDTGIVYGISQGFNQGNVSLKMDVYYPSNDSNCYRPMLLWIHGGGFYEGSYRTATAQVICDSFARKGYVAASISYRLGYYRDHDWLLGPYAYPYGYDDKSFPRAVFRAMQDAKGAIRYLKGLAGHYQIDTNKVFVAGESAGAFTALHVAYLDKPAEKPPACDSVNKVVWLDAFNNVIFSAIRPDLGSIEGDLNLNGTSSRVKGVLNVYGAILDTSLIEQNSDPALFQYYIHQDPIVACYASKAYHQAPGLFYPFTGNTYHPLVYGPCAISQRVSNLGFSQKKSQTHYRTPDWINLIPHSVEIGFFVKHASWFLDSLICEGCQKPQLHNKKTPNRVCKDSTVQFSLSAGGACTTYQWTKDGTPIQGAINDTFSITGAAYADSGWYSCIFTEGCGTDTLQPFQLKVLKPITNISFPNDTALFVGDSLVLTCKVEGDSVSYQWYANSTLLPGRIYDTLQLYNLTKNDMGIYHCVVSNPCSGTYVSALFIQIFNHIGLQNHDNEDRASLLPNPVSDLLEIILSTDETLSYLSVADPTGRMVIQPIGVYNNSQNYTLNVARLPAGMYLLFIHSQNKQPYAIPFYKLSH